MQQHSSTKPYVAQNANQVLHSVFFNPIGGQMTGAYKIVPVNLVEKKFCVQPFQVRVYWKHIQYAPMGEKHIFSLKICSLHFWELTFFPLKIGKISDILLDTSWGKIGMPKNVTSNPNYCLIQTNCFLCGGDLISPLWLAWPSLLRFPRVKDIRSQF